MRTALVTGGLGFIGGHLTQGLRQAGWVVLVLDSQAPPQRARNGNGAAPVEYVHADVRDLDACQSACQGVDTVFHLAGIASVRESVADPARAHEVNLSGTVNLLTAARDQQVRRLVFSSSAAVYGDADHAAVREGQPTVPLSPYGVSKLAAEHYCRTFTELYGLETVSLRYFNVFGPRQSVNSSYGAVIPRFIDAVLRGERPQVYGDGQQSRDFVHVENVVQANLLAATEPEAVHEVFNIASGQAISLCRLLHELSGIVREDIEADFLPARDGDIRRSLADIGKARRLMGYRPRVGLAEGLKATLLWAQETAGAEVRASA